MESLSENLSVVYVRIQYFLTISRRKRDGKGCDWSSNKILSGNATNGLTLDLIYFVRCLLCTGPIKYQIGFLKLWKFIYKTIYKYFVVNI